MQTRDEELARRQAQLDALLIDSLAELSLAVYGSPDAIAERMREARASLDSL